jgi:hypothetical protein
VARTVHDNTSSGRVDGSVVLLSKSIHSEPSKTGSNQSLGHGSLAEILVDHH